MGDLDGFTAIYLQGKGSAGSEWARAGDYWGDFYQVYGSPGFELGTNNYLTKFLPQAPARFDVDATYIPGGLQYPQEGWYYRTEIHLVQGGGLDRDRAQEFGPELKFPDDFFPEDFA